MKAKENKMYTIAEFKKIPYDKKGEIVKDHFLTLPSGFYYSLSNDTFKTPLTTEDLNLLPFGKIGSFNYLTPLLDFSCVIYPDPDVAQTQKEGLVDDLFGCGILGIPFYRVIPNTHPDRVLAGFDRGDYKKSYYSIGRYKENYLIDLLLDFWIEEQSNVYKKFCSDTMYRDSSFPLYRKNIVIEIDKRSVINES